MKNVVKIREKYSDKMEEGKPAKRFKVMIKYEDCFATIFSDEIFEPGEWLEASDKIAGYTSKSRLEPTLGRYLPGFHVFKNGKDAVRWAKTLTDNIYLKFSSIEALNFPKITKDDSMPIYVVVEVSCKTLTAKGKTIEHYRHFREKFINCEAYQFIKIEKIVEEVY